MEIELTSTRDDGSWTWRKAGAREPKGVVTAALLPSGAKLGDVLRAEVDVEIDGISVKSFVAGKSSSPLPALLDVVGSRPAAEGVTSDLRRPLRDRDTERGDRGGRGGRDGDRRGPRPGGGPGGPGGDRRGSRGPSVRPETRGARPEGGAPRGERLSRGPRPDGAASRGPRPEGGAPRGPRPESVRREPPAPKPKPKRLVAGRTHRDALLAGLEDAERRVAEQLLTGGINAVRQSIDAQNKALTAEGKEAVDAAPLLTLADDLQPRIANAEWRDFADAAIASANEIALKDLRSVVAKGDGATRDDETRLLAAQLREALEKRVETMKQTWVQELTAAISEGRLVRALRISGQPPEPGSKFPEELSTQLTTMASAALNAETLPDRWALLADAVATSSVRRAVTPAGAPAEITDALRSAVTKVASRVPAIAAAIGIAAPTPPPSSRPAKPAGAKPATRAPRAAGAGLAKKPAPPPRPPAPPTGPRVMIGGRAIPPPPRRVAAPEPADSPAQEVGNDGGVLGDAVAGSDVSATVPTGDDVVDSGTDRGAAVVAGVADEQDVASAEPEAVEDKVEPLGTTEVLGEAGDGGEPPEAL